MLLAYLRPIYDLKRAILRRRKFLATESPLKVMRNVFYFTLKALSVHKIFKFLPLLSGHV